jgi:hypothetical protein
MRPVGWHFISNISIILLLPLMESTISMKFGIHSSPFPHKMPSSIFFNSFSICIFFPRNKGQNGGPDQ